MNYIVVFEREVHDEVFGNRKPAVSERFDQMVAEFHEFDPSLTPNFLGHNNIAGDEWDVFTTTIQHDGDCKSLQSFLQEAYDDAGVAGFFEIVARAENIVPVSQLK